MSEDFVFLDEAPTEHSALGRVDVMLITNVLHELSPDAIAEALITAHAVLESQGHLIVNELFPLLEFEEAAMPFRPGDMKTLLSRSGFQVEIATSMLRSTTAYAAVARKRSKVDVKQVSEAVWYTLRAMLNDRLDSHGVGLVPTNYRRIAEKVQEYATIATIVNHLRDDFRL